MSDTEWKTAYARLYEATARMLIDQSDPTILVDWDMMRRRHPNPEL